MGRRVVGCWPGSGVTGLQPPSLAQTLSLQPPFLSQTPPEPGGAGGVCGVGVPVICIWPHLSQSELPECFMGGAQVKFKSAGKRGRAWSKEEGSQRPG